MNAEPRLHSVTWRKSSYSGGSGSNSCVEIADGFTGALPVRDSKDPNGPALTFAPDAWSAFVTTLKANAFPTP
ncbi:DUF397 domain-containing protein [Kitasatospora sp. RB6PN24]|uniref:DUF397 domain-containing protein n=1 Tax=Kitasatospora humi TaxID=2893891 RepID=UPI001E3A8B9E|nr:DUF397 domain-containing protein [Kitasatospora humi]MCC9311241.1 DUF397 domain-containing protein [Kitasatospora humi]